MPQLVLVQVTRLVLAWVASLVFSIRNAEVVTAVLGEVLRSGLLTPEQVVWSSWHGLFDFLSSSCLHGVASAFHVAENQSRSLLAHSNLPKHVMRTMSFCMLSTQTQ